MNKKRGWGGAGRGQGRRRLGKEKRVKTSFSIDTATKSVIDSIAKSKGMSRSQVIDLLISHWLTTEESR